MKIIPLALDQLKTHPKDPFLLYQDDKLQELADSLRSIGQLEPIVVRPCDDGFYQILSGKNRVAAARLNYNETINAIIQDVDDDEAVMILTESNLKHREKLLPSEKALSYMMQMNILKKQGQRSDLTGRTPMTAAEWVAEYNEVSKDEIKRHIRLTYLIPEFLSMIDEGILSFSAGVDISYLHKEEQQRTYRLYEKNKIGVIDTTISAALKQHAKNGKISITIKTINQIVRQSRSNQSKPFTIPFRLLSPYKDKLPAYPHLEILFMDFLKQRFR